WAVDYEPGAVVHRSVGLDSGQRGLITVVFRATSDDRGSQANVRVVATAIDTPPDEWIVRMDIARVIWVMSTADSGPATLREGILEANRNCTGAFRCVVNVEMPGRADVPVVDLLTPLPPITAVRTTIGTYAYDPGFRPIVELNGAALTAGNGLELRGAWNDVRIRRVAIRNFPENGIAVIGDTPAARRRLAIEFSVIGDNALRGISVADPSADVIAGASEIGRNGRSGISIWQAAAFGLTTSFLGVTRAGAPWPNAASGLFVAPGVSGVAITSNVIGSHPEFGVALGGVPSSLMFLGNTLQPGGLLAFDYGLDGPTPNDVLDTDGIPNTPILLDATYDAARDRTMVRGYFDTPGLGEAHNAVLYAGAAPDRFGVVTGRVVGGAQMWRRSTGELIGREFTAEIPGDLRGQFISAQMTVSIWADWSPTLTSEFSRAIEVK
ncbi:MAG TPA: right-handed parallel beta-helix repeat-containing protein, partial [Thermoanaerobaculia bacterium]